MTYTTPTAAALQARYPAFAAVADATIEYWIADGETETSAWNEADRARGVLAYAAHKMAENDLGTGATPAGVTSFKSGTFSATLSDSAAARTGFEATIYGREFLDLARRKWGGPRLAHTPTVSISG